jgi:Protein of unknown function (DUF3999)
MKPIVRIACLCGALGGAMQAQSPASPESLTAWPYYKVILSHGGLSDFNLDRDVLDKSRADQADLRLYDSAGHEIPYSLRVRRDVDTHSLFTSHEFNRAVEGTASVVSCDLGAEPQEHNEVVISTAGDNFRRIAQVEGSPDGAQWFTLASQAILFRFSSGGRTVEQDSVSYPVSRYRYIRVRVDRDPQIDHAAPEINTLSVSRSVRARGENTSFEASMGPREADPFEGRPASIFRLDLGARVPIHSLLLNVAEGSFSRPFQLEIVDDPASPQPLASGDLVRTEEHPTAPVRIDFTEQFARRLKLTIVDDRNPSLEIPNVTALSAARQIVFQAPNEATRLYYGNPKGIAPHYDAADRLPADTSGATHLVLGTEQANPIYRPEAKAFSERSPWLVYVVLIAACVALAAILVNLAKASARAAASS